MSTKNNPSEDDTTSVDELARIQSAIETLTRQRDKLAEAKRAYADGDTVDLSQIRLKARQAIDRVLPATSAPESENESIEYSVRDLLTGYWDQVKKRKNVATTSFGLLDNILSGGIEDGRLVVVLGAPNTGKTTFVHQMADFIADGGRPVLYVTSEDSPGTLLAKTLARRGKIPYTTVLKGSENERVRINTALAEQFERKSSDRLRYLDATSRIDMRMIREKAAAHFANFSTENGGGPGVLIVDYLQRIARAVKSQGNLSADLREVVTQVATDLRAISQTLQCGVIAIASQNRTGYTRSSDTGAMASAKESGDIEYTCDVLMSLSEDKDPKRKVPAERMALMLYVDKNRQGQRGKSVALDFWPDRQQFTEAENE